MTNIYNGETMTVINYSANDIKSVVNVIKTLLKLGKGLAALTPTTLDDNVVSMAENAIKFLEPFLNDPNVVDALKKLFDLASNNPEKLAELVKSVEN
jgi:hypothetical protein